MISCNFFFFHFIIIISSQVPTRALPSVTLLCVPGRDDERKKLVLFYFLKALHPICLSSLSYVHHQQRPKKNLISFILLNLTIFLGWQCRQISACQLSCLFLSIVKVKFAKLRRQTATPSFHCTAHAEADAKFL